MPVFFIDLESDRRGARPKANFIVVDTPHQTISALVAALSSGLVIIEQLYTRKGDAPHEWIVVRRQERAISMSGVTGVRQPHHESRFIEYEDDDGADT